MIGNEKESVLKCYQKACIYMSWHFKPYQWKMYHSGSNDASASYAQVVFCFTSGQASSSLSSYLYSLIIAICIFFLF